MYLFVLILTEFGFELDDFLLQGWDSLPQPSNDSLIIQDLISTVNMGMKCGELLYKLLFSRGFYFRVFRESNPRKNFHFNLCLFIELNWNYTSICIKTYMEMCFVHTIYLKIQIIPYK